MQNISKVQISNFCLRMALNCSQVKTIEILPLNQNKTNQTQSFWSNEKSKTLFWGSKLFKNFCSPKIGECLDAKIWSLKSQILNSCFTKIKRKLKIRLNIQGKQINSN